MVKQLAIVLIAMIVHLASLPVVSGYAQDRTVRLPDSSQPSDARWALVIGNSDYEFGRLRNAGNDAEDCAAALRELGFSAVLGTNWTKRQMEEGIRQFGANLRSGGVGLFYFAGHGLQVAGRNFLIPIGARIEKEQDVEFEAVDAGRVLAELDAAGNGLNIVILDACRNNPFARSFRSQGHGLASIDAPVGTLLAYATAPGSVASDGPGRNGTYTGELLRAMRRPGMKVEDVLKEVRGNVRRKTNGKQVPWESSSLEGDFYFAGRAVSTNASPSLPVVKEASNAPEGSVAPPTPRLSLPAFSPLKVDPSTWPLVDDLKGDIDILRYSIKATLLPLSSELVATTTVTFRALKSLKQVRFELNGSLVTSSVRTEAGQQLKFQQDTLNEYSITVETGLPLRVGQEASFEFQYRGRLDTAEGGPLGDKRLAYIGRDGAYVHYSSRWLPSSGYAADRATMQLALTTPREWKLAAWQPVQSAGLVLRNQNGEASEIVRHIRHNVPVLAGTFAVGRYSVFEAAYGDARVDCYYRHSDAAVVRTIALRAAQIVDFYQRAFGPYAFGVLQLVEIDDESLRSLSAPGVVMLSRNEMTASAAAPGGDIRSLELSRIIARQWWGEAVGLGSFADDLWLSLGLAEFSAFLFEESTVAPPEFLSLLTLAKSAARRYERDASILRAPMTLNDQTAGFDGVVRCKTALMFQSLRKKVGDERLFRLLRGYYAKYQGKCVSTREFRIYASQSSGVNLEPLFEAWLERTDVLRDG